MSTTDQEARSRPERSGRLRRARRMGRVAITLVVLAVVVPAIVVLVTAWARGWTIQAVRTGSMEPGYPVGSAMVLTPVDPADVEAGTVIGFQDPDTDRLVAHRVTRVVTDDSGRRSFATRGDANLVDDAQPVPARLVRGEVRWRVLGLGRVIGTLRDSQVQAAVAGIPIGLLLLSEVGGRIGRRRSDWAHQEIARLREEVERLRPPTEGDDLRSHPPDHAAPASGASRTTVRVRPRITSSRDVPDAGASYRLRCRAERRRAEEEKPR